MTLNPVRNPCGIPSRKPPRNPPRFPGRIPGWTSTRNPVWRHWYVVTYLSKANFPRLQFATNRASAGSKERCRRNPPGGFRCHESPDADFVCVPLISVPLVGNVTRARGERGVR